MSYSRVSRTDMGKCCLLKILSSYLFGFFDLFFRYRALFFDEAVGCDYKSVFLISFVPKRKEAELFAVVSCPKLPNFSLQLFEELLII